MGVFDIVMEKPAEVSRSGGCVWYRNTLTASTDFSRFFHDYIKHTHRFGWLQQVFSLLYQTHSPLRLTSAGFFMTISNTPIASTDFSNLFHDYIKHTHRLDWLQQVFPWLYQTHPSPWLTSAVKAMGVFEIVMEQPAEVSRGDGCVWYSHGKTCWSQSKRWVCLI
jgi:hypothetical protein